MRLVQVTTKGWRGARKGVRLLTRQETPLLRLLQLELDTSAAITNAKQGRVVQPDVQANVVFH